MTDNTGGLKWHDLLGIPMPATIDPNPLGISDRQIIARARADTPVESLEGLDDSFLAERLVLAFCAEADIERDSLTQRVLPEARIECLVMHLLERLGSSTYSWEAEAIEELERLGEWRLL